MQIIVNAKWTISYYQVVLLSHQHVDSLVQDCSNSIANALELLQSFTSPSIWFAPGFLIQHQKNINLNQRVALFTESFSVAHNAHPL